MNEAREENYSRTIVSPMKQFHIEGRSWDVQLQVGAKLFKCRRSFLAEKFEYFDTMFGSDFKESNTTPDQPITLHEMDASAFQNILDFIYTGTIRVNESNVLQLLFMSDFLRLRTTHIKKKCIEYLRSRAQARLRMSNVFDLLNFACLKSETLLIDILSAHVCEHLYHFSNDDRVLEMNYESLSALVKFSKNYILPLAGSHNVVLKIILNWVSHNHEERSKYCYELMENIMEFLNVSSSFKLDLMNGQASFADEVLANLSNKTESLEKLEILKLKMETNLMNMDNQPDAIIVFNVDNIFETINERPRYSSTKMISSLLWRIGIQKVEGVVSVCLQCTGTSATTSVWNCFATAIVSLVSHKLGRKNLVRRQEPNLFSFKRKSMGFIPFLKWIDLIDPKKGYIRGNKSITIKAHVYCDIPFGERGAYKTYNRY